MGELNLQSWFDTAWTAFREFFSKVFKWSKKYGEPIVLFLEKVNEAVKNPALDIVVHITTTGIDDKILALLRFYLPAVILKLDLVIDALDDEDEALRELVNYLRSRSQEL